MAFSLRAGTNWCHDFPKLARESGFCFNMHRTRVRVDWNRISSIDIDRVIRDRDFSTVDENVNNVVDYCLESEYDVKILDPNFVKLFRLAQLAVEYLLYCKQYLDHSIIILKDELRLKIEDNAMLKKESITLEDTIKDLRDRVKERDRIIESKMGDSHGELHKCPYCKKTFISASFVSAHIARRHPNLSDPYSTTSSPVHEQYRAETEKLHNEIKTLKERLNQTERVIRNESDKVPDYSRMDRGERIGRYERGEHRGERDHEGRIEEQHRRYHEEIASLKNMLFNEIRNLKQNDKNTSPVRRFENDITGTNLKEVITQQEKEIQRMRDQLRERLTPDLESVQEKLQSQEHYWKSKIEHIESQHHLDTENLSTQLKLTQAAANRMKAEYESKVIELETQSLNQTKILAAQGEQLKHLSRDIRDSRKTTQGVLNESESVMQQKSSSRALKSSESVRDKEQSRDDRRNLRNSKNDELVFEDVGSLSSQESSKKLTVPKINGRQEVVNNSLLLENVELDSSEGTESIKENTKLIKSSREHSKKSLELTKISENTSKSRSLVENLNLESLKSSRRERVVDSSPEKNSYQEGTIETFRLSTDRHTQIANNQRSGRSSPYIESVQTSGKSNKSTNRQSNAGNEKVNTSTGILRKKIERVLKEKSSRNLENRQKSMVESEEDESFSETESESEVGSESQTDSQTENIQIYHRTPDSINTAASRQNYDELMQENPEMLEQLREGLNDVFEKKLRDLGIDPEWNGIPKATFKQKIETVKHHQNMNSKKLNNYNRIRLKIIEEVSERLATRRNKPKNRDLDKKSTLDKLMSNVRNKAMNILKHQKSYEQIIPVLKSRPITPREIMPRKKSSLEILPKKISKSEIHEVSRQKSPIDISEKREPEQRSRSKPLSVRSSDMRIQHKHKILNASKSGVEMLPRNKAEEKLVGSSNSLKQMSHSYESIKDFLEDTRKPAKTSKAMFEMTSTKVTSTPNKTVVDITEESYTSFTDESDSQLTKQEKAHSLPASPKNNKSVLKSTTGSVGSLIKKKVIFDLEQSLEEKDSPRREAQQSKTLGKLFPEYDLEDKELNDDDWNISSISEGKDEVLQNKKFSSVENIVLKTSQSDKIAKISKKIQEQLSISRQKPVGAVEAMFLAKPAGKPGDQKDANQYPSSTSITSSILESPTNRYQVKSAVEISKVPQPVPRTPRAKDSDLDSDIEEFLHME